MAELPRLINLEGILRECIETWGRENPADVVALDEHVKMVRATRHRTTEGLSLEKTLLHKGEIPVDLHAAIQKRTHRDWLLDPELRNLFFRIFRVGCVNRFSETKR